MKGGSLLNNYSPFLLVLSSLRMKTGPSRRGDHTLYVEYMNKDMHASDYSFTAAEMDDTSPL